MKRDAVVREVLASMDSLRHLERVAPSGGSPLVIELVETIEALRPFVEHMARGTCLCKTLRGKQVTSEPCLACRARAIVGEGT